MSGQRKALIVANGEYEQEALRDLVAPAADAEALGRVLGDRQIGDFTVQVVRNQPAHVISAQIEELFSESRRDDVLLLHFSGHGLKSESGELFFAASNTRPNRLGSTAVSADFVQRCMRASRSRSIVLLLDCCYGGAFAQGVKVRAAGDVNVLDSFPRETRSGGGRGRAVITASSAMEFAFEGDQLSDQRPRPSAFTSALVEGLSTGDADRDEDGWVSLNELYDYVFDKVREQNPHQTPSRQVEMEGELYLAHSRRRRIVPAPLPPDLQAAIADPNMYTRLGAISELQSRLASDNLPAAAGAYEALADLARNDIRTVAEPASAAVDQAAIHPEVTELHFGEQWQGSEPPHQVLRLLGPPIARACAPRASDEWIRVSETAEGFDVSVDTANAGTLRGTLDLKGPTGEAVIAIDVELIPQQGRQATTEAPSQAEERARKEAAETARRQAEEKARQEAAETARRQAEEKTHQEAAETARRQAEEKTHQEVTQAAVREADTQARQVISEAPSTTPPHIRRGVAFAGSGIALLAGITGLVALALHYLPSYYGNLFFASATYLTIAGVAIVVLLLVRIGQLTAVGFLQGLCWPAVAFTVLDIWDVAVNRESALNGRSPGAFFAGVLADVLAASAAVLLLVSWRPAVGRRRASGLRPLPVVLLGAVGLSQVAGTAFWVHGYPNFLSYVLGIAGLVVGLAVTWYAVSLRAHALGGALVLGWAITSALAPVGFGTWSALGTLVLVLLAAVVILAIIYWREPSDADPSYVSDHEPSARA
ncbi:MAG TPA: caspase family protein [Streptosporangiaceae bacterium]|nr:caspase family protein [Streptosporangiaceae bacterium]